VVSRAEAATASQIRTITDRTTTPTDLSSAPALRELLPAIQFFLPEVLGNDHAFWRHEGLDAIFPLRAESPASGRVDIYGLALLIGDQSLTPVYTELVHSSDGEGVSWVQCKMGERDASDTRPLIRAPYTAHTTSTALRQLRDRMHPIRWAFTSARGLPPNPERPVHVISENCPVGCGIDVVLLRSISDASIFSYCQLCGCGWRHPNEARFAAGLQSIDGIETFAPAGIDVPTLHQVENAGLARHVRSTFPLQEWSERVDELNDRIANTGTVL
jgi:hypothetical protein